MQYPEAHTVDGIRYMASVPSSYNYNAITDADYEIWVKTADAAADPDASGFEAEGYQKVAEGTWQYDSSWKMIEFDAVENVTNIRLLLTRVSSHNYWALASEIRGMSKAEALEKTKASLTSIEDVLSEDGAAAAKAAGTAKTTVLPSGGVGAGASGAASTTKMPTAGGGANPPTPPTGMTSVASAGQPDQSAASQGADKPARKKWPIVVGVVAGVLVLAVRAVWAYRRLCRQVALACKTPDGCYSGACVPAPFTLGIVRPRIYLPAGLAGPMRAAVLLHERTHLRRGDPLIKPLFYAVACLHWFNPLAWLAFRQLEREMEAACDEAAVRGCDAAARNAYCETILRYALQGRLAPGSLAFGQGSAKTRIVHLLRYRRLGGLALALCALGVGVSVTACMVQPTVAEATPETAETTPALTELTPESAATPETAVAFTPNTAGLPNLDDPAASPRFACPVDYTYISRYAMDGSHRGDDLTAPKGTPVYAAQDGVVAEAAFHYSYGNFVKLDHGQDAGGHSWTTLYGHMDDLAVQPGQVVKTGDLLGHVGSTGNAVGNHLHFEMLADGVLVQPRYFTAYRDGERAELTAETAAEVKARLADAAAPARDAAAFVSNTAGLPNLSDPANSALLQSPLQNYKYTSVPFGDGHRGVDVAADAGTPVYAAQDAYVTVAEWDYTNGNWVELDHGVSSDGRLWTTRYSHMEDLAVQAGQIVHAGDLLGHVGSTGNSTGNHLHFEVAVDGVLIDPKYVTGEPFSSYGLTEDAAEITARLAEAEAQEQQAQEALRLAAVQAREELARVQAQLAQLQEAQARAEADGAAQNQEQAAQLRQQIDELQEQCAGLEGKAFDAELNAQNKTAAEAQAARTQLEEAQRALDALLAETQGAE